MRTSIGTTNAHLIGSVIIAFHIYRNSQNGSFTYCHGSRNSILIVNSRFSANLVANLLAAERNRHGESKKEETDRQADRKSPISRLQKEKTDVLDVSLVCVEENKKTSGSICFDY